MSHFCVYVFGKGCANKLEPFDENTENSKYLVFKDVEEEFMEKYNNELVDAIKWTTEHGKVKYFFEDDEDSYSDLPENQIEKVKCARNKIYATFDEYIKDYFGEDSITKVDGKKVYGYYYNPNAKWDWYQTGGRFENRLLLKSGESSNIDYIKNINFTGLSEE